MWSKRYIRSVDMRLNTKSDQNHSQACTVNDSGSTIGFLIRFRKRKVDFKIRILDPKNVS